jgi:hypothetical protein
MKRPASRIVSAVGNPCSLARGPDHRAQVHTWAILPALTLSPVEENILARFSLLLGILDSAREDFKDRVCHLDYSGLAGLRDLFRKRDSSPAKIDP